jgi:hypothetical protein
MVYCFTHFLPGGSVALPLALACGYPVVGALYKVCRDRPRVRFSQAFFWLLDTERVQAAFIAPDLALPVVHLI